MTKNERETYGTFVALWDPDFDAVRAAMAEVEKQIERHKDEIDPNTIATRIRAGNGPFAICVYWMAKGRKTDA